MIVRFPEWFRGNARDALARSDAAPMPCPAQTTPLRLIDRMAEPNDEMVQLLFEHSTAGKAIMDRQGRVVRANSALSALLGPDVDCSVGRAFLTLFDPQDRDALWEQLRYTLDGRPPLRDFAAGLAGCREDAPQSVDISAVPLREADGEISGLILLLSDTTVQKRLEVQLVQSQKLQAVGQLAGGIAHDFNNLLTAVLGATEIIVARPGVDLDTLDDVAQIRRSAERGADLVRKLLAFGRQQTLQPRVLAINEVIRDLSSLLRRLLGSQVSLELDLEEPGSTVRADPTQLDQVLVNLAVNARDAMPSGGRLLLRSGHITLYRSLNRGQETIPPGRFVMIEVEDSGNGIPPEVLPRIFDPFFTTRRELGGTGLGLSTVHGIIRQSDGFVAVESEVGKGTRMRVYLPRHDQSEAVRMPLPPLLLLEPEGEPSAPGTPLVVAEPQRIALLVDDEEPVRRLAERALRRRGWQVLSADSAEAALTLLEEREPVLTLLITDVVMPGMDGPALVARVRERCADLPAILVSGYAEEMLKPGPMMPNTAFLPKPYTLQALLARADAMSRQGTPSCQDSA
jgi:two-component system cell cycle sensor histidine kinase/response regulator CckA